MSNMSKTKVAITGTIGSGKSSVVEVLRDLGHTVFVSDEYNSLLLEKGNEGYKEIVKHFDVLDKDLNIDKKKLASIVFNDPKSLKLLQSFTTDKVIEKIKELLKEDEVSFFEVPLLYECQLESLFDKVLVITADNDLRIERLIKRGLEKEDAIKRIENQISDQEKINKADLIIYNNDTKEELYTKVKELFHD